MHQYQGQDLDQDQHQSEVDREVDRELVEDQGDLEQDHVQGQQEGVFHREVTDQIAVDHPMDLIIIKILI